MAWVAADRFLGLSNEGQDKVQRLRDAIHADVCKQGFEEGCGSFMQSYGSRHLDASMLLPPDDERSAVRLPRWRKG